VASATAERSFSVMRHLKSQLRASMADSRFSICQWASWEIGDRLLINPSNVIDEFAASGNRRVDLLLQSDIGLCWLQTCSGSNGHF